jgi:hypothetical protein
VGILISFNELNDPLGIGDTAFVLMIAGSSLFLIFKLIFTFWIYKATMEKGMPSPPAWSLLALFFPIITLLLYLFNKPEGEMVDCPVCENKKLEILYECPHCKVRKENLPISSNKKKKHVRDANGGIEKITPKVLSVKKKR